MPACKDCGHWLPTVSGLNKHVAGSKACRQKWRDRLKNFSVDVFDLGGGYSATAPDAEDVNDSDGGVYDSGAYQDYDAPSPPINVAHDDSEPRQHARVEEVPDEPGPVSNDTRWIESYAAHHRAGAPCREVDEVTPTKFDQIRQQLEANGTPWGPFDDEEEWELAKWLIQNVGQNQTDKFLKLPIIQNRAQVSYANNRNFLKKIDALPTKGPEWHCDIISVAGDQVDTNGDMMSVELELWRCNPVECV
ncbi:hypothetical protein DFH29DRAFT_883744 [Suillus ampliporus]|nr:hypothetical protein DFH29DRAFT_883744 [Suillus ampliporus]